MAKIIYKRLSETAIIPTRATGGSAGYDLYADLGESATTGRIILGGEHALIKTGIAMIIPPDMVGYICPRSGWSAKYGITVLNGPGIIDSDYRGDVGVILHNTTRAPFRVEQGDRIAQIVFAPYIPVTFTPESGDFISSDRGEGGFGSSGR